MTPAGALVQPRQGGRGPGQPSTGTGGRLGRALSRATPWLVGAFYGTAMLDLVTTTGAAAASLALTVALSAALIWRHERPELVTGAVLAVSLGAHLLVPEVVVPVGGMVAVWALARARPPRVSLLGLAGLVALSAINLVTTTLDDTLFTIGVSVAVWALAEAARNRATAISEATRRAVSEEQARIARELHDVVAHSVTVIVVQAGAANDVFDSHPEQARTALRSIEGAGREALRELRRLLTDVRTEGGRTGDGTGDGAPGAADVPAPPQPGLDRVDELAAPLRAAGLQVVVTRDGPPVALPPGVDISAYRIVQEALTNILRHARASVAEVTFRYGPDAVEIEVVDDGRPAAGRSGDGPGLGLVGMNERASTLGGTFEAGPTAHGGFRVHARLPLDAAR